MIEQIEWIACAERLPENATAVLLYQIGAHANVWPGWRDGDAWRWADGMPVRREVTHWAALPVGPRG